MSVKNSVQHIPLASIDSATFTGDYQAVNTDGFPEACWQLHITNLSNRTVFVSINGVDAMDVIAVNSTLTINSQQNRQPNNEVKLFPKGTIIYVSGQAMGTGVVYVAAYY